jgi:hypothetical protein
VPIQPSSKPIARWADPIDVLEALYPPDSATTRATLGCDMRVSASGSPSIMKYPWLSDVLDMFVVEGIYTTIPLHQKILADPDFIAGKTDTNFLKRYN